MTQSFIDIFNDVIPLLADLHSVSSVTQFNLADKTIIGAQDVNTATGETS
jgi:hypothetical protein